MAAYAITIQGVGPLAHVPISFTSTADQTPMAAVAGITQKLFRALLVFGGSATLQFWDGPSVNANPLSGPLPMTSGGSFSLDISGAKLEHLKGSSGNAIVFTTSVAVSVGGWIQIMGVNS